MYHRRALSISILTTLVLAIAVLLARDQISTLGNADASQELSPTTVPATATELPLVNLVRTSDGQTVAIPADSLAGGAAGERDDDEGYDDDEREYDDDHDDDEDAEDDHD